MATKKNIKPVDTGETFTSLQISKSIDQDSMETKLRSLYKLQKTDSKIDGIYMLRGELPLEVQDLEDEIMGLKTKIATLQKEIKEAEETVAKNKLDIQSFKATIKKYEAQRNNVKNNREFDSLSKEIEFQELASLRADKRVTAASKVVVEKKETLELVQAQLKGREGDLENKRKELDNIAKETEKEEAELVKQSEEIQAEIDPRILAAYEKVRSNARNKMAVVTVVRGACGGCFSKIPPQRQIDIEESKKIIVCEYCGRILVSSKFDEEENGAAAVVEEAPKAAPKKKTTRTKKTE
ncbi:MAG: zinc ribbon domain-containing protein [Candidatus Egerieousia sp.]